MVEVCPYIDSHYEPSIYKPRKPTNTPLYKIIQEHLETYLEKVAQENDFEGVPHYVEKEFHKYLECGILANGFARAYCDNCHKDFLISFSCKSPTADEIAMALNKVAMGSFVGSTNTFTDGDLFTAPKYGCGIFLYCTSAIGSGSDDVITVTYTNNEGTTGRTGTATFSKSSVVGTRIKVALQAGDIGVLDVTNVTHSATGQAGDFNIEGIIPLFRETMVTANVQYNANSVSLGGIVVLEGETVYLWYLAGTKTSYIRDILMIGTLVPRA